MNQVELIRTNLQAAQLEVQLSAKKSGRNNDEIKIIVVSKRQSLETVKAAILAGVIDFGENYPEEAVLKIDVLKSENPSIKWHMIGHLQSRKARLVADHFDMLHSLDSVRLASKINGFLETNKKILPVLIEANVSGEESKGGWPAWDETRWPALAEELEAVISRPFLQMKGLMTMPPLFENPEDVRPYFQKLRKLKEYLQKQYPAIGFTELSMGTSADYKIAIEEGATIVRIGQAILGPRPY